MPAVPSLLIVEDSLCVLARLVSLAREYVPADCIATATSGTEAVEVFDRWSPQLVVMDIGLPGRNGLEVLQHIRSRSAQTEVLVFTSSASPEMETGCSSLGANHFLDKSKDLGLLSELLRNFGGSPMATVHCS